MTETNDKPTNGAKWSCVDCGKTLKRRGYRCTGCKTSNKPPPPRHCREPGCGKVLRKPRVQRCEPHRRARVVWVKARRKQTTVPTQAPVPEKEKE